MNPLNADGDDVLEALDVISLGDRVAVDYGADGLYLYNGALARINTANPSIMTALNLDGDADMEMAAGFPGYGLDTWDDADGWSLISADVPELMVPGFFSPIN